MTVTIPNLQARRHLLELAGLGARARRALDRPALGDAIHDLGFVQVDSISIVERAHHHILFCRGSGYRQGHLRTLLEKDRALFENWTHDASIIPTAFFPYWRHRFARERTRLRERWKDVFGAPDFDRDLERVLDRVARDGPAMARDFEGDKPNTGWWDWHPSKSALEYLWRTGELAIARRDGFQKVYDLTERVIPAAARAATPDHEAFVDWACRQALARLGCATRGEIASFWGLLRPDEVAAWLCANEASLRRVAVEAADGGKPRAAFAFPEAVEAALVAPPAPDSVRILSPFDPLLRDRARAERVFGFHYRIEVFVPEARRRYGYYVFPVMRGERIVGRIDMKAERAEDALTVRAFWPEAGIRRSAALLSRLDVELDRMRRFAGVSAIRRADDWLRF